MSATTKAKQAIVKFHRLKRVCDLSRAACLSSFSRLANRIAACIRTIGISGVSMTLEFFMCAPVDGGKLVERQAYHGCGRTTPLGKAVE